MFCTCSRICSTDGAALGKDAAQFRQVRTQAGEFLVHVDAGGEQPALQLRYTERVKTATIPSVRVEPDFRAEVEAVLADGETLSEFVEASIRANVERRRVQAEFIARGLRSREEARRTGEYVDADVVLEGLQRKLDAARARLPKKRQ